MPLAFLSWAIGNVLTMYSLFYGASFLATISNVIQLISYIAAVAVTINMALIVRGNAHRVETSTSSLEEFAFFSYMIPILIYAPSVSLWNYSTNNTNYANYSELSFLVTLVIHYLCGVILIGSCFLSHLKFFLWEISNIYAIGASGRMLRLLAVSNINLLNLKQIFVRYMSHESRQLLRLNSIRSFPF